MSEHNGVSNQDGILVTKILQVQNKRYYFDVKEHEYGRFLKLAETAQNGRKSRLVFPMYLVPEVENCMKKFREKLASMPEFEDNRQAGGDRNESSEAATEIMSDLVERGRRRYYFNLKENSRGRYLRVKALGDIPQNSRQNRRFRRRSRESGDGNVPRAIILPAVGIDAFHDQLAGLWKEFPVNVETDKVALSDKNADNEEDNGLPKSARLTSREFRKVLFLDAGENSRGVYCRVTEQQSSFRDSITIPREHFAKVGEWFLNAATQCPEKVDEVELATKVEKLAIDENLQNPEKIENAGSRRRAQASESD